MAPAKSAARDSAVGARRDGLGVEDEVGLVGARRPRHAGGEACALRARLVRDQRRRPVFVGDAEPAARRLPTALAVLVDARVLDPSAALRRRKRRSGPHAGCSSRRPSACRSADQGIGRELQRRAAAVLHAVGDREHVSFVDRERAAEEQALAVVPLMTAGVLGVSAPCDAGFHLVSALGRSMALPPSATSRNRRSRGPRSPAPCGGWRRGSACPRATA